MNVWIVMVARYSPHGKPMAPPAPARVYKSREEAEAAMRRWSDYNRHDRHWITCVKMEN